MNPKNNKRTSILGMIAAALIASQADIPAAISGDPNQITTVALGAVAGLFGWLTNR